MKTKTLKLASLLAAAGLAIGAAPLAAQTRLVNEHADIGIAYEDGMWNLHIHDETNDREFSPPSGLDGAILEVGALAQTAVSADPRFSFLGAAGSSIWILPNTQNPNLLFLGFGAEELETGLFVGDSVSLRLHSISGPGEFAVFDFDSFGNPLAIMNTRDGISAGDVFNANSGAHQDLNFAFSQPGIYTVNFEASGTLADGNMFTSSGPVAYTFEVVPEPSTWALMALGLGGACLLARRRTRA
jgi:surface-anchored protein